MGMMSLKEAQELEAKGQLDTQPKPVEEEEQDEAEEVSEPEGEAQPEAESADWMKGDEEAPEPESADPDVDGVAAKVRRKWKGRLKEEQDANAKLQQEIEELKRKVSSPQPAQPIAGKPQRAQYQSDDEYQEALTLFLIEERDNKRKSEEAVAKRKQQNQEILSRISQDVDSHYERAIKLAQKSNITPDAYKSADLTVRQAFDALRPGEGDALVDGLIHMVGPGSERTFFKLGVSKAHREKATQLLKEDPTGLRLSVYLGELNAELKAPTKRETKAPDPAPALRGDKSNTSVGDSKLKKEYDAAMAKGNTEKAWQLRRQAKATGSDVAGW